MEMSWCMTARAGHGGPRRQLETLERLCLFRTTGTSLCTARMAGRSGIDSDVLWGVSFVGDGLCSELLIPSSLLRSGQPSPSSMAGSLRLQWPLTVEASMCVVVTTTGSAGGYRCHQGPLAGQGFGSASEAIAALAKRSGSAAPEPSPPSAPASRSLGLLTTTPAKPATTPCGLSRMDFE